MIITGRLSPHPEPEPDEDNLPPKPTPGRDALPGKLRSKKAKAKRVGR